MLPLEEDGVPPKSMSPNQSVGGLFDEGKVVVAKFEDAEVARLWWRGSRRR